MTQIASTPLAVHPEPAVPASPAPWNRRATALLVLLFILAGHIWSIDTGLFLDDHAHYAHLREAPWTIEGLVEASRLGIVGDVMDLWGRRESGLRFFRPVAFAIMKLEYTVARWQPLPMHLFSLAWHFLCAMLVAEIAYRCLGNRFWAAIAAALMAIHPGHVATVYWIACQTELITTAFLLVATLAYARYARWETPLFLKEPRASARAVLGTVGTVPIQEPLAKQYPPLEGVRAVAVTQGNVPTLRGTARAEARGSLGRAFWAFLSLVCYALALGCRENAVLFPIICFAGDRLLVARENRRFRVVPLLMLAVLAAYFVLRHNYLGGFQLPARPYIYPLGDPGFARYVIEKIVYYTIGLFGFVPVIPMGGQAYFASRPAAFYGGFAGTLLILLIIWATYGFRRALLWPIVWIACTIAPVIPVFASSHHLYLPSVGTVLLLTAGLAALGGLTRRAPHPLSCSRTPPLSPSSQDAGETLAAHAVPRAQVILCGIVLLLHAVGLSLFTWGQGFAFRAGTLTEDILIKEILQRSTPIRDGDHLYFINMPILAYYAIPALETQLGWNAIFPPSQGGAGGGQKGEHSALSTQHSAPKKLHGHVLTFSPWLMRMEKPGSLEVLDEHRMRVRAPVDARYFEGVTGRTLLQAMGLPETLTAGKPIRDDRSGFTVTPTRVDDRGVLEFIFEFDRPISSPDNHFVFGSPQFLAYPLSIPKTPGTPTTGPTSSPSG